MTASRTALLMPLVALLAGCPKKPVDFGPGGEAKNADELLKRIELAESTVLSVKGEAKLKVESPRGNGSAGLFVAAMHPAFIHLEALDFFGRPQAVLVTDGTVFRLYDAQQNKFFKGPATPQNMSRLLPIVMPPQELAALLLGRVPRLPSTDVAMGFDQGAGRYQLTLKKDGLTQVLEVSPPSHRVTHSRFTGTDTYEVSFADIEHTGATDFPRQAKLSSEQAKTKLELNYKDLELNPEADLTMFELDPPENVPVVEVDEMGLER